MKHAVAAIFLIFSSVALADYEQYKDLTKKNTDIKRISSKDIKKAQLEVARRNVERDQKMIQKEEENLRNDKAQVKRLEDDLSRTRK